MVYLTHTYCAGSKDFLTDPIAFPNPPHGDEISNTPVDRLQKTEVGSVNKLPKSFILYGMVLTRLLIVWYRLFVTNYISIVIQ